LAVAESFTTLSDPDGPAPGLPGGSFPETRSYCAGRRRLNPRLPARADELL
jgi:hypothetical protein